MDLQMAPDRVETGMEGEEGPAVRMGRRETASMSGALMAQATVAVVLAAVQTGIFPGHFSISVDLRS